MEYNSLALAIIRFINLLLQDRGRMLCPSVIESWKNFDIWMTVSG
jgi:hypothetical protein